MTPVAFISPDEYAGLLARITLLENRMATEIEAVANLTTQVQELSAAVPVVKAFIVELKAQVVALQEAVANNTDVSGQVADLATIIDTAEQELLAVITPPPAPPVSGLSPAGVPGAA